MILLKEGEGGKGGEGKSKKRTTEEKEKGEGRGKRGEEGVHLLTFISPLVPVFVPGVSSVTLFREKSTGSFVKSEPRANDLNRFLKNNYYV